jgi:hypothetical protein
VPYGGFSVSTPETLYLRQRDILFNGIHFRFSLLEIVERRCLEGLVQRTRALQVVASWKAQTLAGPQPESLKMTYLDEWLEANVLAGSVLVDEPKVCIHVQL